MIGGRVVAADLDARAERDPDAFDDACHGRAFVGRGVLAMRAV
jgi:hypothetical protein